MTRKNNKLIVILGPTSSGKSDIAIKLAKKFDGEIVSADSRQIYRGLEIGTGIVKGTWNMEHGTLISEGVPHYLISSYSPRAQFSVARFKKEADKIIEDILKRGKLPIICGGTGFWIKSIVDDITYPEVKPDLKLRKVLNEKSTEELFEMLEKMDPERASNIDSKNKVRLVRAIEICQALGKVPIAVTSDKQHGTWKFLQIGIKVEKEKLYNNIKKRLEQRFQEGMIEEVEKLRSQGLSFQKIQSFGLGYFWIPLFLQRKIAQEELFEKI
jgi:tRNA dimethylallyltransferase